MNKHSKMLSNVRPSRRSYRNIVIYGNTITAMAERFMVRFAGLFLLTAAACFDFSPAAVGTLGDFCRSDGTCDAGLTCGANNRCETCDEQVNQCSVACDGHFEARCDEGHVYWFDSCGAREDRRDDCHSRGCNDGKCGELGFTYLGEAETALWDGSFIDVQVAADGHPIVAVALNSVAGGIAVRKWTGAEWQVIDSTGGSIETTGPAVALSLKLAANTAPVIAWIDGDLATSQVVHVAYWQNRRWFGFGGATGITAPGSTAYDASLALDNSGRPNVAWPALVAATTAWTYVRSWNGSAWTDPISGSSATTGISNPAAKQATSPVIAWVGSDLLVAETEQGTDLRDHVRVRRPNRVADTWSILPGNERTTLSASYRAGFASLASLSDGTPLIAFRDNNPGGVHVLRWTGTDWQSLDFRDTEYGAVTLNSAWWPQLAVDDRDNVVLGYVYWVDAIEFTSAAVHLKVWRGGSWGELTPGSDSLFGVSARSELPTNLRLGSFGGKVCAAWSVRSPQPGYATRVGCVAL